MASAGASLPRNSRNVHWRCKFRQTIKAALLACGNGMPAPMLQFFVVPGAHRVADASLSVMSGTIPPHTKLRRLCYDPVHALTAGRYALPRASTSSGDSRSDSRMSGRPSTRTASLRQGIQYARAYSPPRHQRACISATTPSHAARDHVVCRAARDKTVLAWLARELFDIAPRQSRVAFSMPSSATPTMRSISSGVMTYGGMK